MVKLSAVTGREVASAEIGQSGVGEDHSAGYTASTDFATRNPVQARFGGGMVDAFVLKVRISDWSLVFSA